MSIHLKYKFIHVSRDTQLETHAGKPMYYIFSNSQKVAMGRIFWYPAWRQWVVNLFEESVWSTDCLECVQDAIEKIKAEEAAK